MVCNIISSGSHGNAVLYHDCILVDIGVSYTAIKNYIDDIQLVLLTHEHFSDHLNISTLKRLQEERPTLRIGCGPHMLNHIQGFKNIDVYHLNDRYDYGAFSISTVKLYHDVENIGFRIFKDDHKILHVTDTFSLEGITAKNYDLYAIEHNYDEDMIKDAIQEKSENGEYIYEDRAFNTHLSEQKARDFIWKNKSENSEVIRLHQSANY